VKDIVQNVEDIFLMVNVELGAGYQYEAIKNTVPIN
jgi:hypothetical protein